MILIQKYDIIRYIVYDILNPNENRQHNYITGGGGVHIYVQYLDMKR